MAGSERPAMGNPAALLSLLLLVALLAGCSQAAVKSALVNSLPGFEGSLPSEHYAGYVTVDGQKGRALYYYFVTSEREPSSDPLILWLNGGPGCSSFDGFVYENGPFLFKAGSSSQSMPTLSRNEYSWAKVANMLFLDSPAGVGYSYSNTTTDYTTGDKKTANDSHQFLLKWFELYPEYLSNEFYIIGESYAGVYIPTLAQQIVNGIEAGVTPKINFKGYMIGNGVTDPAYDGNALVPFVYGMGLISIDLYQQVSKACDNNYWNATDEKCRTLLQAVHKETADINIYDILEPCYHDPAAWQDRLDVKLPSSFRKLGETDRDVPIRKRMFGRAWPLKMQLREGLVPSWPQLGGDAYVPCLDTHVAKIWLNNPEVREALHAAPENVSGPWTLCTSALDYSWDAGSMIPIHKSLTRKGYRAHIYSGDHDMCVPYTGSEVWTRSLGYKVVKSWHPWLVGEQVAGYSVSYDHSLIFSTVKGAGHSVPEYKPKESLALLQRWLSGNNIID